MKIKRLYINNYKSLVDFELLEPNPFSVFVGPNAAGKSNVFEALEFLSYSNDLDRADDIFGGAENYLNKQYLKTDFPNRSIGIYDLVIALDFGKFDVSTYLQFKNANGIRLNARRRWGKLPQQQFETHAEVLENLDAIRTAFIQSFSRLFVGNWNYLRAPITSSNKLALDCSNLEPVLHRILQDEIKRERFTDWVEALIPGLEKVEVGKHDLSGDYFLSIFEKNLPDPIGKHLISDGTYNILALLTAVFQNDEPQFLCIEEPENGLTPYVQRELVEFFREICEEKGHYIWLNTHSPFIVRQLKPKEIILLDKKEGITKAKQLDPNIKFKSMPMDEAWLTNSLGGGLPW
ncbi:MAG: AAA family ATPase [Saprospiraceae bacterium]|nr:AAA family ATPase [Saprospiraceae bacterium]